MRIEDIKDLGRENFNPIFINALRQYWKTTRSFQCIGTPKKQNLFLYLDGCRITYTDKYGNTYSAKSGDVVYTPVGSEYRAELSDFQSESSHTVGINFLLKDENGEPLILSDKIKIFHIKDTFSVSTLFDKASIRDSVYPLICRSVLLEILSVISSRDLKDDSSIVSKAVIYLSENAENNPSVSELARMYNVSEVYFRRKFKEIMGISPAKYKNAMRLNKAVAYLEFGGISVQEISETLGYSTVSHFIKEFKAHFGFSPLQYRNQII